MNKNKYVFKPYNPIFPILFEQQKEKLNSVLSDAFIIIEHIGSAVVGGGGKGIVI